MASVDACKECSLTNDIHISEEPHQRLNDLIRNLMQSVCTNLESARHMRLCNAIS